MYNSKLVAAVKSSGKILREFKDQVYVPFGTEYSLLIKNLNSVRASVRIFIDGTDATEGISLVIPPNQEIELERFIKNANMEHGNKFKFIERTVAVEKHRGIKLEDGLIKIEFQFEKVWPPGNFLYTPGQTYYRDDSNPIWNSSPVFGDFINNSSPPVGMGREVIRGASVNSVSASSGDSLTTQQFTHKRADDGITVPGSLSDQRFTTTSSFLTETEVHVMILKLVGSTSDNVAISAPVTVKSKPTCVTCGRINKATSKFCTDCGTALTIV